MNGEMVARKGTYAGLFCIALATLMFEILLTRIFSVTMWYHLAFVAISVAMFGMTVGAILVYLSPNWFAPEKVHVHLSLGSLLFGLTAVASFLVHANSPAPQDLSLRAMGNLAFTYAVMSVPFVFSGVCVCLALTRFPRQVSRLYAADLAGAALGCVLLIYTLKITDGPTAVIVVAALGSLAAVCFAADAGRPPLRKNAQIVCVALIAVAAVHTVLVQRQTPLFRLRYVKGKLDPKPAYEKWNSFSRVQVAEYPDLDAPLSWSLSPLTSRAQKVKQAVLNIDSTAATLLTGFDGNTSPLAFLKEDMVNFAHHLRPDSDVLVIGVGGGRDILSALVFDQKSVTGVEINEEILKTVNRRYGDYTGHLDRHPRVRFANDEARSYVARSKDQFDVIQISLIDTWAATAAGAFALAENSLYTVEAWKIFLDHLTPRGILTVSRWYFRDRPGEVYRMTALATEVLMDMGVKDPAAHVAILRLMPPKEFTSIPDGIGTILVGREPFTDSDLETLRTLAGEKQFTVVLLPGFQADPVFGQIVSGKNLHEFTSQFPINIASPTDDSPFFFHMLRLRNVFDRSLWEQGVATFNMKAVFVLATLLATVVILTFLCIVVPLLLTARKETLAGVLPLFVFFGAIGLGFMLIEISQLQRLIIFLGHPTYGLSVVLFSLLLSSGLGSYLSGGVGGQNLQKNGTLVLLGLVAALVLFGILTPHVARQYESATNMARISLAVAMLFPLGLFMGMAFPLGMKAAARRSAALTPWLWGINGATSVCASVLAVAIALTWGISTTFWTGMICYVAAALAFVRAARLRELVRG